MKSFKQLLLEAIDITQNENFRKWFKNSKVVDSEGKPLRVYHGTSKDFPEFNTSGGTGKTFATGAYFTANVATANTYAGDRNGGNITPVYLSLQHPAIFDANGANWNRLNHKTKASLPEIEVSDQEDEDLLAALQDRPAKQGVRKKLKAKETTLKTVFPSELRYIDDFASTDDLAAWARKQGYDGVIIRNVKDHGPSGSHSREEAGKPSELYVVFSPTQIKSAVGNNGNFDPDNSDITK